MAKKLENPNEDWSDQKEEDWSEQIEIQREKIIEDIASRLSKENPDLFGGSLTKEAYKEAEAVVRNAVLASNDLLPDERDGAVKTIMGQASGYGPLAEFFVDDEETREITEVMVNPTGGQPVVFYGKHGRSHRAPGVYFRNNDEVSRYARKVCEDVGRPFVEDSPIVDAWLQDGSRIAVMGYKVCPLGVSLSIRKSPLVRPPLPLSTLVENGTLPKLAADIMVDALVKGYAKIGVFGRTDSGKTAFMRALAEFIDKKNRVVIGETSFELFLPHLENCINLTEVVYGPKKIVSMIQICEAINRINPDRAILGEVRGAEILAASEMAESTSGGFWTTGHFGGVNDLRSKMPKMFARAGHSIAREFIDDQIRCMFDFLIFLDKDKNGKRTFMSLVEVTDTGYNTVFRFDEEAFAKSGERRWIYETPITTQRLSRLAFRGAVVKPEYEKNDETYLYPAGLPT